MHVGLVVPYFPLERHERGYPHVMETIERLAATCRVSVVALRDASAFGPYTLAGAQAWRLGMRDQRGPVGRARVLAAGVRRLLRIHRRAPLDVVHGMWLDEPGAVAAIAARLLRRPSIASVLGGELVAFRELGYGAAIGRGGRWTNALTLRLADEVTVGSVALRQLVDSHRRGARLLPLGVDTQRFRPRTPAPQPSPRRRILFVGALVPIKQPALALRTFARLSATRDDLELAVYGSGSLDATLAELCRELGIAQRVRFHGHLPHPAMPDAYTGATLLLVTSRFESQSVAALEAAASGVPVVGPRIGLLPEMGAAVALAESNTEAELGAAAARVLDDPQRAAAMAAAGRALAVEGYDIEHTTHALLDLYRSVIGGAGGGADAA